MYVNNVTTISPILRRHVLSMGILCIFLFAFAVNATAQKEKRATNLKAIGIGYSFIQDTYLSPEHYQGPELRYMSHTIREQKDSTESHPMHRIINEGVLSRSTTKSGSGSMLAGYYHFEYGMMWHCFSLLNNKLRINAGGEAEALAGFLYSTRNGNNPAQARVLVNIGGALHADYSINSKMTLNYDASLPLLGLTFSPNYGQSYYEIFDRMNYDHNIVPTTIGCMPSLRHQLTFVYYLHGYGLTIGYLGDYRQQAVNNLKQHVYSHSIILGITKKL